MMTEFNEKIERTMRRIHTFERVEEIVYWFSLNASEIADAFRVPKEDVYKIVDALVKLTEEG